VCKFAGYTLTADFRRRDVSRVPRAHLAEPRNDPLQLTIYGKVSIPETVASEPSRRTVITEILSICIQVRDCTCDRGVRILAIRQDHDDIFVRTFYR
jgi:hypothetical protein